MSSYLFNFYAATITSSNRANEQYEANGIAEYVQRRMGDFILNCC